MENFSKDDLISRVQNQHMDTEQLKEFRAFVEKFEKSQSSQGGSSAAKSSDPNPHGNGKDTTAQDSYVPATSHSPLSGDAKSGNTSSTPVTHTPTNIQGKDSSDDSTDPVETRLQKVESVQGELITMIQGLENLILTSNTPAAMQGSGNVSSMTPTRLQFPNGADGNGVQNNGQAPPIRPTPLDGSASFTQPQMRSQFHHAETTSTQSYSFNNESLVNTSNHQFSGSSSATVPLDSNFLSQVGKPHSFAPHQASSTPRAHAPIVGEPRAPDSLSPGSRQAGSQRRRPNPDPNSNATNVAGAAETQDDDGAEGDGNAPPRPPTRRQLRDQKWSDVTLKRSLSGHLTDGKYLLPILRLVGYFSRMMNLGSILMNACLVQDLNQHQGNLSYIRSLRSKGKESGDLYLAIGTAMKLFTFNQRGTTGRIHERNTPIKEMYENHFAARFGGLRSPWENLTSPAMSQHAKRMATCFRNTFLQITFEARLKAGLKNELSQQGLDPRVNNNKDKALRAILQNNTDGLQPEMVDFTLKIRKILQTGDIDGELPAEPRPIDEIYLEEQENWPRILKMYHLILQNMDAGGINHPGKRFSIFPIFGMQSQHVIVEKKVLKKIMVETGDIHEGMNDTIFEANIVQHFDRVFNTDKLRKSGQLGRDFSNAFSVETDGVAVSFKFLRPPGVEDEQRQFRDDGAAEPDPDEGTWGIDPGVNNILYAVRQIREDELEHKVLSRKRYYRDAGVDRAKKVTRRGEIVLQACRQAMAHVSIKTANLDRILAYIDAYRPHFQAIWQEVLRRRYAQSRFSVYLGKRRVLDKFFQSLKMPGNARTNIAYGGARFPHSKKNWGRSVPTVSVRRACVRFFRQTVQVDEYRTSKVCPQCLSQLQKVLRRLEGERFPENQRGILRCPSIQCASCTFKNRDEVGARNILACHMAERRGDVRPGLLQFGFNQGWQANPKPSHYLRLPRGG